MEKVIIIYSGDLGLQVMRLLGEKGIKSIAIYNTAEEAGIYSKYVIEKAKIDNYLSKEEIRDILLKNKERWKGLLVLPCNDESVVALSYYKKELSKHYIIPLADYKIIKQLINKKLTYKLAKKAGIPIPKIFFCKSLKEVEKNKRNFVFPCILKPYERHKFSYIFKTKLFEVYSYEELVEKFSLCEKYKIEVMISEIIPGNDTKLNKCGFYVSKAHQPVYFVTSQTIRQNPPNFGVSRVARTTKNPDVIYLTKKLLKQMPEFVGVAQVEYKFDERDKTYKFLEINSRNILTVGLWSKVGINIPYIIYMDWVEDKTLKVNDYRENTYWIHLYSDLFNTFSKRRKLENYSLMDYIKPYFKRKTFPIESLRDLLPMVIYWKDKISDIIKWLAKRIGM